MGYKVYVKDKMTKGRYASWDNKTYKTKAAAEDAAGRGFDSKYYHTKSGKRDFGKPHFQVRSTGQPKQQGFGFGSALSGRKVKWF